MAITSQAECFLNAYHVLARSESELQATREKRAQDHNAAHPDNPVQEIGCADDLQTGVADFVCLAFAVELYLKAVFEVLGHRNKRGHKIRGDLFDKLPPDVQNKIFNIHMKNVYNATLEGYKERMDVISEGFEKFRYLYEHKTLTYHKGFALEMIKAMKQFISDERTRSRQH